jgi:pimeloyl-ACP methyl ester carboxylesterase
MTEINTAPLPAPSPMARINGVEIHYELVGSGPHLVLVHGLMGSLADWRPRVVPLLADQFTVLTWDLRGHGDSDMPPSGYTSADMAADLAGLMDHVGAQRADLVGHSFGGVVALHMAALHPGRVKCLTISDSRIRALQPVQKLRDWVHWPVWNAQLKQLGVTLDEDSELDFALLHLIPPLLQHNRKREEKWKALLASTTAVVDLRETAGLTVELIQQVRVPTQAIYGELSPCLPTLEGLRANLPGLKSEVAAGLGHFFPLTKPALFVDYIKSFHQAVASPATAEEIEL